VHATAATMHATNWQEIVSLYDIESQHTPRKLILLKLFKNVPLRTR
jgi:predicted RNA polymerase sigma factor